MAWCECKKPIKHCVCKEDYAWNHSICVCECDKDCEIGEYLKDSTCTKSLVDIVGVTCDEVAVTSENASINFTSKRNYWLLCVVLLAITCLLLFNSHHC